jgi:transcriptional regulator with XRE-family HTH domain
LENLLYIPCKETQEMADQRWIRFGKEIKHHRVKSNMSQTALAAAVHAGDSTIAAYETGRRAPDVDTAKAIDEALSAGGSVLQVWNELADEREIPEDWRTFEKVERQAVEIRAYQMAVMPGILQTPDYTREILRNGRMWSERRIEHLVEQRTARFEAVGDASLSFVIDEPVLRRTPGSSEVMRQQLDRVLTLVEERRIWVSVFPTGSVMYPGFAGSFRVTTLQDGRIVGHAEHLNGLVVITAPQVNKLVTLFGNLQSEALGTKDSASLIYRIRNEL